MHKIALSPSSDACCCGGIRRPDGPDFARMPARRFVAVMTGALYARARARGLG
jgi:hypothetical protein